MSAPGRVVSALRPELVRLRRRWARPGSAAAAGTQATTSPPVTPGRRRAGPALVMAATALAGFLLVSQLGTSERFRQRLEAESEEDLARILSRLTGEADALRDEISDLKLQLVDLQASTRESDAADQAAQAQVNALSVLAGTVAVTGPGLTLVVQDPDRSVRYDVLLDALQELRDAGAEALAINGARVGVASSLAERDGRILLDGVTLAPPYRIAAIGPTTTLDGGLKIPGGVLDTLDALQGVRAEVQRAAKLDLPPLAEAPTFSVARPVGSGS